MIKKVVTKQQNGQFQERITKIYFLGILIYNAEEKVE